MGLLLVVFCAALGAGAALTAVRMFVATLKLGPVQEPQKVEYCLDVIANETERLSGLISRLLSWGAMEAGRFNVMLIPRAPGEVVRAALAAFEPQLVSGGG